MTKSTYPLRDWRMETEARGDAISEPEYTELPALFKVLFIKHLKLENKKVRAECCYCKIYNLNPHGINKWEF